MRIIYGLNKLERQKRKSIVTMGIFDGVHTGHQKILNEVVIQARKKKLVPAILTFHPHPQKVLGNITSKSTITSLGHRLKLFEGIGIELCVVVNFTPEFSNRSIEWFVKNILVKKLKAHTLIVGSKFRLGSEHIQTQRLKRLLSERKVNFKVIHTQKYKQKIVSSSLIRQLIEKGKLATASKLLGRGVAVYGTVKKGKRKGRKLGFRTANVDPHHEVLPPAGVYAVKVKVEDKLYKGALNIGFRPTFNYRQKEPEIEVHIIGFKASLYYKYIDIIFIRKLRQERHFKHKKALMDQIRKDIKAV